MASVSNPESPSDPQKKHAAWIASYTCEKCPVYYIDSDGIFQEYGKERKRKHILTNSTVFPEYKRKHIKQIKVYGPDSSRNLEKGEWELVDVEM